MALPSREFISPPLHTLGDDPQWRSKLPSSYIDPSCRLSCRPRIQGTSSNYSVLCGLGSGAEVQLVGEPVLILQQLLWMRASSMRL